mmetsp:Transcript_58806/g.144145  ORF Transcript_58806/g.144145 Transcript_58806/m.144145 type:complete len:244 (-) Transcript_58806:731-1462(-)
MDIQKKMKKDSNIFKKKPVYSRNRNAVKKMKAKEWIPITKLGRMVKKNKIKSIEEIFYFSLPIKEKEIVEHFLKDQLEDEVLKIMPVQKQTRAGQRTRFKAFLVIGDTSGHVGLGIKTGKEAANAIKGALSCAKLSIIPAHKGYWGGKIGKPHTFPMKVTGKCGSIRLRCVPAPRGAGIVAARIPKKLLTMAGYQDVFTESKGYTRTFGNFAKATFNAIYWTFRVITPNLWPNRLLLTKPTTI